ncbi:glutamate-5-semialdehyde dehydrogenase [Dactylosporangium roseum]|uniref:Gamma-glutamyl phosphate reductase n=2 Tax=Dactylosporangium roseum TaxID=47989 RepID=A0ABY5ZJG0_9ACTN|nr:glutamate-5-semialdehyde dehydrogenase [Dactylosporangium roseum]
MLAAAGRARAEAPAPGDGRYLAYCDALAAELEHGWDDVIAANAGDLERAQGLPETLVDRLRVTRRHLPGLLDLIARVRRELPACTRPGDEHPALGRSRVRRVPKPLGVLLMIYEARPTVTVEGALLPVAVGNAVLLRGGGEIASTNAALASLARAAARTAGLPDGMVQVITDPDRRLVRQLLRRHDAIDAVIPRGSASLIEHCRTTSSIPVIASGGGANHLYVDAGADLTLAARITLDSKVAEPTACNTLEMVLAHRDVAGAFVAELARLAGDTCGLRLAPELLGSAPSTAAVVPLQPHDDGREFLDGTIAVRAVDGLAEAAAHIRAHGSRHTEGVVAADPGVVEGFLCAVDAAALVVNGSLRLHDGPTMRLGPELSISTGRLHVRGPVGLAALLTYSWAIDGNGTLREEER